MRVNYKFCDVAILRVDNEHCLIQLNLIGEKDYQNMIGTFLLVSLRAIYFVGSVLMMIKTTDKEMMV